MSGKIYFCYKFDGMATVNFLIKGNEDPITIYVRFVNGKKHDYTKSTKKIVNLNNCIISRKGKRSSIISGIKKNSPETKNLNKKLRDLKNYIIDSYDEEDNDNIGPKWLERKIEIFNGDYKPEENKKSNLLLDAVGAIIDNAHTRENSKGGLGLSLSRINSYKTLRNILTEYQGRKKFVVSDVNIKFGKDFLNWMLTKKNYSESYSRKKIDDLKTVCTDAEIQGIPTSPQLKKVKGGKPKNDTVIYLDPAELSIIKNIDMENKTLENSKKWLLLGCNIGQRGSDLLALRESNFVTRQGLDLIELKQKKTGKNVTIPVLETTKEILKEGLPYPISIQKFNDHLKLICEKAGLNEVIPGSKIVMVDKHGNELEKDDNGKYLGEGFKRKLAGYYPKWQLISSHVCRRSFASNQYGILPTPLIMQITAHSTEKMLLNYIGKSSMDYAQAIAEFYKNQKKL